MKPIKQRVACKFCSIEIERIVIPKGGSTCFDCKVKRRGRRDKEVRDARRALSTAQDTE